MMLVFLISFLLLQGSGADAMVSGADVFASANMIADATANTSAPEATEEEGINVGEIIFEHIGDEYEWHITEWKGKPVAIPLPCIVIENGVHVFTLHHAVENGYTLNEDGKLVNAETGKRPLDLSITKNVRL